MKIEHPHAKEIGAVLEGVLEPFARVNCARAEDLVGDPRDVQFLHDRHCLLRSLRAHGHMPEASMSDGLFVVSIQFQGRPCTIADLREQVREAFAHPHVPLPGNSRRRYRGLRSLWSNQNLTSVAWPLDRQCQALRQRADVR